MRTPALGCLLVATIFSHTGQPPAIATSRGQLVNVIPADMRPSVMLTDGTGLAGDTVRVRYGGDVLRMEVGPAAETSQVEAHMAVARELSRYQGMSGIPLQLLSRAATMIGAEPGYGTDGFEARLEVMKLEAILSRLQGRHREADRDAIASLRDQLAYHTSRLNSFHHGRGFVAAYAPQDPASSLEAWLHDVWSKGMDNAYALYVQKPSVTMDPEARKVFFQQLLDMAANPNVGGMILQKAKFEWHPKSHLPTLEEMNGAGFIHFVRADSQVESIAERIYIDVHPDHAAEVMGFIVSDVLSRPGIVSTKVADPSGLQVRADSILIYAHSLADVDWALGRLSEYQAAHRNHFLLELPAATRPRSGLTGVGTAAQPARDSDSFGSYLSRIAQSAMHQSPPPADFAEFRSRFRALLTADGVDPEHPDRLARRP